MGAQTDAFNVRPPDGVCGVRSDDECLAARAVSWFSFAVFLAAARAETEGASRAYQCWNAALEVAQKVRILATAKVRIARLAQKVRPGQKETEVDRRAE